jgi:DNA gyrase subunit A
LREIKRQYGDPRRTEIVAEAREITIEDMIAEEDMVLTVSRGGYIKRSPLSLYRAQRRGGKGKIGMATKEEDIVEHLFVASTHSYILVFTDKGRVHWLKVHAIPEVASAARGKAIVNLLEVEQGENMRAMITVKDFHADARYVVLATRSGKIKKTELAAFSNPRSGGIIAIDINEGDDLHSVQLSDGDSEIFIGTYEGMAIRFKEGDVRPMGRGAAGVKGIQLREGDHVVEMSVLRKEQPGEILTVTEKGFGKRTPVDEYRLQTRGGTGVINVKTTEKNGNVVAIEHVSEGDEVLLITEQGKLIRVACDTIRSVGRSTQGVKVINIEEGDSVVSAVKIVEKEDDGEGDVTDDDGGTEVEEAVAEEMTPVETDPEQIH